MSDLAKKLSGPLPPEPDDIKARLAGPLPPEPPTERPPSPGLARYDLASLDPADLAAKKGAAVDALALSLMQHRGMNQVEARQEATRQVEAELVNEAAAGTTRARTARALRAEQSNEPSDVFLRTVGPRATPMMGPARSAEEKRAEWQSTEAANRAGLGDVAGAVDTARRVWTGTQAPVPEEEAKAEGLARPWVDDINMGLAMLANAAMPDNAREAALGALDETRRTQAVEGAKTLWKGIVGYGEDKDVQRIVSAQGAKDLGKRTLIRSGLVGVGADVGVAATETAADVATYLGAESLSEKLERNGLTYAEGAKVHQFLTDSTPSEFFDGVMANALAAPDPEMQAHQVVDDLTPAEIPDRDVGGRFAVAAWRAALSRPEVQANPELADAVKALNESDDRLVDALRSTPYRALRTVEPGFGPDGKDLVGLAERRVKALRATGGESTEATEKVFASILLGPKTLESGETVYVERPAAQILRLAGAFAEGVYETDVRLVDIAPPASIVAALSDVVGADEYARELRNLRLPTKAGLDMMAQSGVLDTELALLGLDKPKALRTPGTGLTGWLSRVATNVQMPEFQGPGYRPFYLAAGGDPTSDLAGALGLLDVGIDFVNPIDDHVIGAAGSAVRRVSRAGTAASIAPAGTKGAAALAAALPEFSKTVDRDGVTAVQAAVEKAIERGIDSGEMPEFSAFESPELVDLLRVVTDKDVLAEVKQYAEGNAARVLTEKKKMLDSGKLPEVEALRKTQAWQARKAEIDAVVAASGGKMTADDAALQMRWEEALALAAADTGTRFVRKGQPEDWFGRQKRVLGGTPGQRALFHERPERKPVPTFYSALRRAVEGIKQERLTADQLRATLRNAPGVKADEIEWTRLDDFLREQPKPTKAEVLDWLDENAVVVEEKQLGGSAVEAATAEREAAEDALVAFNTQAQRAGRTPAPEEVAPLVERVRAADAKVRSLLGKAETAPPTQYQNYQLPGGTNYREVLFKLPGEQDTYKWQLKYVSGPRLGIPFDSEAEARAILTEDFAGRNDIVVEREADKRPLYVSPHFGPENKNLLAHVRLNDRIGPNGEKILHVEEIQSDWHQAGREKGYALPKGVVSIFDTVTKREVTTASSGREAEAWIEANGGFDRYDYAEPAPGDRVPVAPFSKTWHELVMKRVLREAAEGGYDGVSWTTGVQQVKRYEDATRQAVDEIRYIRGATSDALTAARAELEAARDAYARAGQEIRRLRTSPDSEAFLNAQGQFDLAARRYDEADGAVQDLEHLPAGHVQIIGIKNGREVYRETMPPEKVVDVLGKGMAAKIAESPEASGSLTGADLTIGGEGMKGFYDQMLPAFVNKYTKRWGGRVGETTIETTGAANTTTTLDVAIRRAREGGDPDSAEALEWLHGQPIDDVRWRHMADEFGDGQAESARLWFNEAAAAMKSINGREPVHYLPLTPQLRDALLYEGQPLFHQRGTQRLGSIEPVQGAGLFNYQNVTGFLQRFFSEADDTTLFHEGAHAARFLFGDDWVQALAQHFDNSAGTLTRKGEEQAAEAFRWYQRVRTAPNGAVQALFDRAYLALDRFWFATRNELASVGLGAAPDAAPLLPGGLAAYWDMQLNPGQRARNSIAIRDRETPPPVLPTVRVSDNPSEAVAGDVYARHGRSTALTDISIAPADIRHRLGIDATTTEMDPVKLYAKAVAVTVAEKFRSRGWGSEPYVQIGSNRTAVPQSRVKRVLDTVTQKKVLAFGRAAPGVETLASGQVVLKLDTAQRAGLAGLINEIKRSAFAEYLPEGAQTFDPLNPAATLTAEEMLEVDKLLVDINAGVASGRNYNAEQLVGAPLITAVLRSLGGVITDAEFYRHIEQRYNEFFGVELIGKKLNPAARSAMEETRRQMGVISSEFLDAVRLHGAKGQQAQIDFFRKAIGTERAVIQPPMVGRLRGHVAWFSDTLGDAEKRAHADVPKSLDDLFGNNAATLTDMESMMASAPHLGRPGLSDTETKALAFLRKHEAQRLAAGQDWPTYLAADPRHYDEVTDALSVVQVGLNRRWNAYLDEVKHLMVAAAGSNDLSVLAGKERSFIEVNVPGTNKTVTVPLLDYFYGLFWTGQFDEMFATLARAGHTVIGPRFNQSQAVAAMLLRLRGLRVLSKLSERLLDAGIAADVEQSTTLGTKIGATYADELGQHGAFGYDGQRARVLHWLNAQVGWSDRIVRATHIDPATGASIETFRQNNPGVIGLGDPPDREAYTLANRYLSLLGWEKGKGTFGDTAWRMPDGTEVFMPVMMQEYLLKTLDETAKAGGAFAGSKRSGALTDTWNSLSKAIAQGRDEAFSTLGLSAADSELGQLTEFQPQQLAAKQRREAAQVGGTVAGSIIGSIVGGWPVSVVGAAVGRNVVPMAIEAAGTMAEKGRRYLPAPVAPLGGALGIVAGGTLGAGIGALKTVSDGLQILYPATIGMARVGMTAGLIVPHAAFFVANAFGAAFQTYMRTGLSGVMRTAKVLTPFFGHSQMVGRALSDMAGWNRVAQLIPDPPPLITDTGGIFTYPMLLEAIRTTGLDSSFVKSMSSNRVADELRKLLTPWLDRFKTHPFDAATEPLGYLQSGLIELGSAIDNANRLGVFLAEVKRGMGWEEAARTAREAAFDYGNLSELERTLIRPIVLFYSYIRQSVGLFWWTAINHPSRVLGTLRASRGLRYQEVEEPDQTLPESADTKLLLYFEEARAQGHRDQGIATVSSPMPIDVIPLFADFAGALGGSEEDWRQVIGRLTPGIQFAAVVAPTGTDLFTGANIDDYNVVPNWLVALDRDLTGGVLCDVLNIQPRNLADPSLADYPGAPRYQAANGRAWFLFRNLIQIPPFGRYLDEMGAIDRAAPLGEPGPVNSAVQWAHEYRQQGGDEALDAFFRGPVRWSLSTMPVLGFDYEQPMGGVVTRQNIPDLYQPREDVTRMQEAMSVLGFKTVPVPRPEMVGSREVKDIERRLADIQQRAEKTSPIYGQ